MWWPRASTERLKSCTFFLLWLFTWDDDAELFVDIDKANACREECYHFLRYALGVGNGETAGYNFDQTPPQRPIIRSVEIIGSDLSKVYDKGDTHFEEKMLWTSRDTDTISQIRSCVSLKRFTTTWKVNRENRGAS